MKIKKKNCGGSVRGGWGWVGVDVYEELKLFVKIQKKMGGGGPGGQGRCE